MQNICILRYRYLAFCVSISHYTSKMLHVLLARGRRMLFASRITAIFGHCCVMSAHCVSGACHDQQILSHVRVGSKVAKKAITVMSRNSLTTTHSSIIGYQHYQAYLLLTGVKFWLLEAPQQTLCCRCRRDTYTIWKLILCTSIKKKQYKILHPTILEILMFMWPYAQYRRKNVHRHL